MTDANTPLWGLTIAYWLHMLATVVWIGGLATLALVVLPAARRALEPRAYSLLLADLQRRLDPLAWFCLLALVGTGMFQMSASPNYSGFLAIDNTWAVAILIKHVLFFAMTGLSAYLTWGVLPGLQRAAMRLAKNQDDPDAARWQQQSEWLLRVNFVLSILVLALTALARAA